MRPLNRIDEKPVKDIFTKLRWFSRKQIKALKLIIDSTWLNIENLSCRNKYPLIKNICHFLHNEWQVKDMTSPLKKQLDAYQTKLMIFWPEVLSNLYLRNTAPRWDYLLHQPPPFHEDRHGHHQGLHFIQLLPKDWRQGQPFPKSLMAEVSQFSWVHDQDLPMVYSSWDSSSLQPRQDEPLHEEGGDLEVSQVW